MTSYFRNIPDLEYINRNSESVSSLDEYIQTKNLFKRVKLRDDIFGSLNFFEKYKIIGDERPDNVASKIYGDSVLDWVVLLSNNILNIQTEWPLSQEAFDRYLFEKYGTGILNKDDVYNVIYNGTHHFETKEITDSRGAVVLKGGIQINPIPTYNLLVNPLYPSFRLQYLDPGRTAGGVQSYVELSGESIFDTVTNYQYEVEIENNKRNIFVLKPQYLNIIFNDIEKSMPYVEGSDQYIGPFLKRVDDIRLYT